MDNSPKKKVKYPAHCNFFTNFTVNISDTNQNTIDCNETTDISRINSLHNVRNRFQ